MKNLDLNMLVLVGFNVCFFILYLNILSLSCFLILGFILMNIAIYLTNKLCPCEFIT